jgi:ParB-like chromosome segregation protein Spo0J
MSKSTYKQIDLPLDDCSALQYLDSKFQNLPISKLILLEKNPRTISKDQMTKLKNSLRRDPNFLLARPICVNIKDDKYYVYAGNQRVRAAKSLEWEKVLCHVEIDLAEDILQERIIKDNKSFGDFDFEALANEWELDMLLDCGFKLSDFEIARDKEISEEKKKSKKDKDTTFTCPNCAHTISL